jgi:hypothetical protein
VSTKAPFVVESPGASLHVAIMDAGIKENIIRALVARGASVTVFPFDYPIHKISKHYHGIFYSNGPGDPTHCQDTIQNLRRLMETSDMPIMGGKSRAFVTPITFISMLELPSFDARRAGQWSPYPARFGKVATSIVCIQRPPKKEADNRQCAWGINYWP